MISSLLLTLVPTLAAPSELPAASILATIQDDLEFEKRLEAAGEDVAKLWELHLWCRESSLNSESRKVLKRVVDLDPDHEDARKALGHHSYDGKWFETYTALSKYKREEDKRMAEKGLVRFRGDWAKEEEVPFLRMSWVKDDFGRWRSPHAVEREKREAELREKGWQQQQDLTWVSPENVEKWNEGLWKCGDQWLSAEEANAYHSQPGQGWTIPGDRFLVRTTCDWNTAWRARAIADATYADLVRAYGRQPQGPEKPMVVVFNSIDQYNGFAGRQSPIPPELSGHSSVHYAFFAESWFDVSVDPPAYQGSGVCYWDIDDEKLSGWGPLAVRHAAGLSFAEAIDPSWDTVSRFIENPSQQPSVDAFWNEKQIPRWLRYGAASYVERYARAPEAQDGEQWGMRNWSIEQLKGQGGLRPFEQIFAFNLDPNDIDGSGKLIAEAGLLTSFILDGKCRPVVEKHAAFKQALTKGEDTSEAVTALQEALVDYKDELRVFAGM